MKVLRGSHKAWDPMPHATAVTVGVFDGVHLGHQSTLRRLEALSGGRPTVVATFDPHPVVVLAPEHAPRLLTTPDQRMRVFDRLGLDAVAFLDFNDDMRVMPTERFIGEILVAVLRAEVIGVGADFRFGRGREGDVDLLARMAPRFGYHFEAVELLGGDRPLSSTVIRRLLSEGELDRAAELLGRPYAVEGTVVAGAGRGAALGLSTANLGLDPNQYIPKRGVYAALVGVGDRLLPGACNIGVRPTFGGSDETIEVHLLDFDEEILGLTIEIEFRHRLRDEREFDSPEALAAQIRRDIDQAAALLDEGNVVD
jgi:riboflavin kinase/FMN adenylyltransferase